MAFELTPAVRVERDRNGEVRALEHLTQPYTADRMFNARALANEYVRDVADVYRFPAEWVAAIDRTPAEKMEDEPTQLRFARSDRAGATATVSYQQTHFGLPIWEAGVSVLLLTDTLRATSSSSTVHRDVAVPRPRPDARCMPDQLSDAHLADVLRLDGKRPERINAKQLWVFRYDAKTRTPQTPRDDRQRELDGDIPTLPLPDVPKVIVDGEHYVVTEVLFTLSVEGFRDLNWRAFVEVETCTVLQLRALVDACTGSVYLVDPVTATGDGTISGCTAAATLDPLRTDVALPGITAASPQTLTGAYVTIVDDSFPALTPPSLTPPPCDFTYSATSTEFAAVNAYVHVDAAFRLVQSFGFDPVTNFFTGTALPVPTYYRDEPGVNAHTYHNAANNGCGKFTFGLVSAGCPVGIADDYRVVLHEFVHAMLDDRIHSGFLGFAHNGGDGFAVIRMDPGSLAPDRFKSFPWVTGQRRHDRHVASGWAFGGTMDDSPAGPPNMYLAEQILSTALFRLYLSTGGDSPFLDKQQLGSTYVLYVMTNAMASLPLASTTVTTAPAYASALMTADAAAPATFNGVPGGTIGKVVRWAFEKQGLYQPPGAPTPVATVGAPPDVDVYIVDDNNGEYPYVEDFWENVNIWNLHAANPATTPADHQTPYVSVPNYAYVLVGNRGTQPASGVVVSAFHCRPTAGLSWPDDWQPMTTASIAVPGTIAPGTTVTVGPFEWTPTALGHECMLMSVSATGDVSNADAASMLPCAAGPTPHWRLVPFDNNLGQRNVAPVAGGGGLTGLVASFQPRRFTLSNPSDKIGRVRVEVVLPDFLQRNGWGVRFGNPGGGSFTLGPRTSREIQFFLTPGKDFTVRDVESAQPHARIIVRALIDGMPIGGMSYVIDPQLKAPAQERPHQHGANDDDDRHEHGEHGEHHRHHEHGERHEGRDRDDR